MLFLGALFFFAEKIFEIDTTNHSPSLTITKPHTIVQNNLIGMGREYLHEETETALLAVPLDVSLENANANTRSTTSDVNMENSVLEDNFALDMNGNEIAVPFSPDEEGNLGTENEYGEGVAVEFEPELATISDTSSTIQLEENYITSIDGDFANPIMLEDSSGESEANPLLLEDNGIEDQYEEDIAMPFDPELNSN